MDESNRLFGSGARIRMVKVQHSMECKVKSTYKANFPICYGGYKPEFIDKKSFGPTTLSGDAMFMYYPGKANERAYEGKVNDYATGGYQELLSADYNKSFHTIRMLEQSDWVSPATRAVFYDFTIYNFNLGIYAVCSFAFEISASGSWVKTFKVDVL